MDVLKTAPPACGTKTVRTSIGWCRGSYRSELSPQQRIILYNLFKKFAVAVRRENGPRAVALGRTQSARGVGTDGYLAHFGSIHTGHGGRRARAGSAQPASARVFFGAASHRSITVSKSDQDRSRPRIGLSQWPWAAASSQLSRNVSVGTATPPIVQPWLCALASIMQHRLQRGKEDADINELLSGCYPNRDRLESQPPCVTAFCRIKSLLSRQPGPPPTKLTDK